MFFVPTKVPTKIATMTKASQPKTAVFQWLALQRPMRAAMLFERFRGDIWPWLLRLGMVSSHSQRRVGAEMRLAGLFAGGKPHPQRGERHRRRAGGLVRGRAEVREDG